MSPGFPSASEVLPVHPADLRLMLALVVLAHLPLYAWAEWRLRGHRRRRAALLAGLPAGAGEVLGWAVTWDGMEVLLYHAADGRSRAAGEAGRPGRERAVLAWLVAEGFLDVAAGPDGGGEPAGWSADL